MRTVPATSAQQTNVCDDIVADVLDNILQNILQTKHVHVFSMSLNMQSSKTLFVRKTVWAGVFELIMCGM